MGVIVQKIFFQIIIIHKVIISWGFRIFQHVECDIVRVIIVSLEIIKLDFGIFEPFVSILEHFVI